MKSPIFNLQQCRLLQEKSPHKIGTDAILLGALTNHSQHRRILDIGTGTGILAIMMAQKYPHALIDALDISEDAYNEASENFKNSPWSSRLNCYLNDVNSCESHTSESYDIIISNPPFFHNSLLSENAEKNKARHTLSLSPEVLVDAVSSLISPKGIFSLIIPYSDTHRYCVYAQSHHLFLLQSFEISPFRNSQPNRIILTFSPTYAPFSKDSLWMYETDNTFSEKYISLTNPFLSHF
ncbi:MAG: methyltransferase [Bacteroidales bacterium]|jgi:tRNA1Val (adenine37-N6)-methyltransferase|nr:methyltransferase [Bacteroidales bacterium]